jgi:hypothetical protein
MFRLIEFHCIFLVVIGLSSTRILNKFYGHLNDATNKFDTIDDRNQTMITSGMRKSSVNLENINCADSRRCGCYKGNCWAYIDERQSSSTGWWCFTQREGIRGRQKVWAKCTNSSQCSWKMTCGDCFTWVGRQTGVKTSKILC